MRINFQLTKPRAYLLAVAAAFLAPIGIPNMGVDWPFLFTVGLVLMAWLSIKWGKLKLLEYKSHTWEMILGVIIIAADYAENFYFHSFLGLIDMLAVFAAVSLAFYGIRSFKFFWVPGAYIVILLSGYYIEDALPQTVGLQIWLANIMASGMQVLGVHASVSGYLVVLGSGSKTLLLSVEGPCTGIQGILAFGMLSSMAVLDIKTKWTRLAILLAVGFIGAFLINIVRLFVVFLTFQYLGVAAGTQMHVYAGYTLFIVWVLVFWSVAFKYLPTGNPTPTQMAAMAPPK